MPAPKSLTCWSCGGTDLEPVGTWFRCRTCGATSVDLPKVSTPKVHPLPVDQYGQIKKGRKRKHDTN